MGGIINSIIGLIIAIVVLATSGWWLFKDARRIEGREEERHKEFIDTMNNNTNIILQAIQQNREPKSENIRNR